MKTDPIERGKRIRFARKARGLRQIALAKLIGIAQSAISDLETGNSKDMEGSTLVGLVKHLGVNPHWIMHGDGPMFFDDDDSISLIESFGKMTDANRAALLAAADALLKSQGPPALGDGGSSRPLLPKPRH